MVTMVASRTGRLLQRYNSQGCRQVVGCIPFRFRKTNQLPELEVLLISSQKSTKLMFPKGGWELDESIKEAASRESKEEAGIDGIVGPKLGEWTFKSKSQPKCHEGHMFPLFVTKELDAWPEQNVRQRVWMSVKEAREVCSHDWMIEALDKLVHILRKEEEKRAYCSCPLEYSLSEELRLGSLAEKKLNIAVLVDDVVLFQFVSLLSCNNQNQTLNPSQSLLPVNSVTMLQSFTMLQSYWCVFSWSLMPIHTIVILQSYWRVFSIFLNMQF